MALETRYLTDSQSFAATATSWGKNVGLLDEEGAPTSIYPVIIGMASGSENLGGFNIGIIQNDRTIKGALQDLETAVDGRMFSANNLSDLPSPSTARTNLGLGSASTWPVGTSGSTIPLLNTINSWSGKQSFGGGASVTTSFDLVGASGSQTLFNILNGTSLRWAMYKSATVDSATSTGSDLAIARYNNSGVKIDDPFSISRATGVVSLSQPLPVASGGTGSASLVALKASLSLNNVDNTADINKPISSAGQTALNLKFDKAGGAIAGFATTTSYMRAGTFVIAEGNADKGGQIILGYRANTGIINQTNNTWNIDVDANNAFRVSRQNTTGVVYNALLINEAGNLQFNGDGAIATFVGTTATEQNVVVRNNAATSSVAGSSFLSFQNAEGTYVSHLRSYVNTNGSSELAVSVTAAGARGNDRRAEVFKWSATAITATVPIDGRAYPRLASGANANFNWTPQAGQPTYFWGGVNGTDMYVYSPSNLSVANSVSLGSIAGGNAGGYIRRTTDTAGNAALSRQLVLAGNDVTDDIWSSPIEIREVQLNGAASSTSNYSPGLLFHWPSVAASAIKMYPDGSLRVRTQGNSSAYTNMWAASFYSNSNYRVTGNGGLYFETYSRGLGAAEAGSSYGHVNTVGSGLNGYAGYSINTWASFMANGTSTGIYSSSQNRWLLQFDNSGNASFPANVSAYSDERLKKNIRPIDNVTYRREAMAKAAILYERDGITRLGFGAQTLELGNPELVTTHDDPTETKSVFYGDAVALLAADNQMLADRLVEAEAKNIILENQIATILARLEKAGL